MNAEDLLLQAEERIAAERERSIAAASAAVSAPGVENCIECGAAIPLERRVAAPWATRCFECQGFYEAERLRK